MVNIKGDQGYWEAIILCLSGISFVFATYVNLTKHFQVLSERCGKSVRDADALLIIRKDYSY